MTSDKRRRRMTVVRRLKQADKDLKKLPRWMRASIKRARRIYEETRRMPDVD